MWGTLMVGALFTALNPVRLAVIALLISRARPVHNLFAYWVGAVIAGIPSLLIPLMLLHSSESISSFTQDLATSATFRHVQVGMGVFALSVALLMVVRSAAHRRLPVLTSPNRMSGGLSSTSTLELEPNTPPVISWLVGRKRHATSAGGSSSRGLLTRAGEAWENGSIWVAALLGMVMGGPSVDGVVLGTALIMASGASIAVQVSAAIAFVFGMLAIVEIILVSSVAAPAKTQLVLQRVHDWVQAHRRMILITLLALTGIALVSQGMGVM
jgi:Sap, sulfolipid-1-addressing protein